MIYTMSAVGEVHMCVREPHNTVDQYVVHQYNLRKNQELLSDIYHKSYDECVRSFCTEGV